MTSSCGHKKKEKLPPECSPYGEITLLFCTASDGNCAPPDSESSGDEFPTSVSNSFGAAASADKNCAKLGCHVTRNPGRDASTSDDGP